MFNKLVVVKLLHLLRMTKMYFILLLKILERK